MSREPTRHAQSADGWRRGLIVALDATNDVIGGITLLALPLAVMTPGLVALLGLSIPLLLPLVALGLVLGILGAPFAGVWMLVRMIRRTRSRGHKDPSTTRAPLDAPLPAPQSEVAPEAI